MNVAWITRSFLDYRIPVFAELDRLLAGRLTLVFSGDYVPESVQQKAKAVLGDRALALRGEWKLGSEDALHLANRSFSIRFQPGLFRLIRRLKPDVMVCDGFFKWTFPALLNRILFRTPLVILYERTFHTERHAQWIRTWYRRRVVRFVDAMGCNGRLCREYAEWLGMAPDRITTGHMAADTEGLARATDMVTPEQIAALRRELNVAGVMLLYVGRLHQRKGLKELLAAWAPFEARHPGQATLVLVGDGDQGPALRSFCDAQGLTAVRFAGRVPYDALAPYYAAADAFIIPTLEDNWSLVVPEAMACGLPILCSKYNGCWPELVHDGQNGWIFDPLQPDGVLSMLERCLESRCRLAEMGAISRRLVNAHSPLRAAESILTACRLAHGPDCAAALSGGPACS